MKLSCENRALIDENVALKSEKMALAAQLPELQSQIRILEQSLAQAEIQTKAFSEKVHFAVIYFSLVSNDIVCLSQSEAILGILLISDVAYNQAKWVVLSIM